MRVQPLQNLVLIEGVQDGCLVVRTRPKRVVRGLRLGGVDFSRMNDDEKQAFFAQFTSAMLTWDFPFQWLVIRRPQDLEPFFRSFEKEASRSGNPKLAQELLNFVRTVQKQIGALTPSHYMLIWAELGFKSWEQALEDLKEAVEKAKVALRQMRIHAEEASPEELLELYRGILSIMPPSIYQPPVARLQLISPTKVVV